MEGMKKRSNKNKNSERDGEKQPESNRFDEPYQKGMFSHLGRFVCAQED